MTKPHTIQIFLQDGTLKEEKGVLVFTSDHILVSPSGSAATILGRSANGWTAWKNKVGKTLDELKRKQEE